MELSKTQLQYIYPQCPQVTIDVYLPLLQKCMDTYEINTINRVRMFLAQIGHESAQLRYTEEIASGLAYEGRKDLGNTVPGDGVKYKGRGLIQLTGRNNYALVSLALDIPVIDQPKLLANYDNATMSAGWFWDNNKLNALCDLGQFETLTKRINGGLNGYPSRIQFLNRAHDVIV